MRRSLEMLGELAGRRTPAQERQWKEFQKKGAEARRKGRGGSVKVAFGARKKLSGLRKTRYVV